MPDRIEKDILNSLSLALLSLEKCGMIISLQRDSLSRDDIDSFAQQARCCNVLADEASSAKKTALSLVNDIEKLGMRESRGDFFRQVQVLEERIVFLTAGFNESCAHLRLMAEGKMKKYSGRISSISKTGINMRPESGFASFLHSPEMIDISV